MHSLTSALNCLCIVASYFKSLGLDLPNRMENVFYLKLVTKVSNIYLEFCSLSCSLGLYLHSNCQWWGQLALKVLSLSLWLPCGKHEILVGSSSFYSPVLQDQETQCIFAQ